jgi:hypothetical protein
MKNHLKVSFNSFTSVELNQNSLRSLRGGSDIQTQDNVRGGADVLYDNGNTRYSDDLMHPECDCNCDEM